MKRFLPVPRRFTEHAFNDPLPIFDRSLNNTAGEVQDGCVKSGIFA